MSPESYATAPGCNISAHEPRTRRTHEHKRASRRDPPASRPVRDRSRAGRVAFARAGCAAHPARARPDPGLRSRRAVDGRPRAGHDPLPRDLAPARRLAARVRSGEPTNHVRPRRRPARAGLAERPPGVDRGRRARHQLPARGRRHARGAARRLRLPDRARRKRPRDARVLQPSGPRARPRPARAARHDRQPDRAVRGAQARRGRAAHAVPDVPRHAVHRRLPGLLPEAEPGLGGNARLLAAGADEPALRRVRASGRPQRHERGGEEQHHRRGDAAVREPLPPARRLLPLARVEGVAARRAGADLRRRARRDRAEARGAGAAAGARDGRGREPRQERLPGQREPRDPHADERRDRHGGAAARHTATERAARVPDRTQGLGGVAAQPDQRPARLLADRGGQARARRRRPSTCAS